MKITKQQLKQVIKEEISKIMFEAAVPHSAHHVVKKMMKTGKSAKETLKSLTTDLSDEEAERWLERHKDEMDSAKQDLDEALGDQASQRLSQAGIAKEPEQVRKELMRMILGLDTGDEEDAEALSFMAAYLKDAAAANVRQGLGLEEGVENITPENIQIAVDAFKQVAMNLEPAVVLPALMMA